jgi:hypothetical protein
MSAALISLWLARSLCHQLSLSRARSLSLKTGCRCWPQAKEIAKQSVGWAAAGVGQQEEEDEDEEV